MDMVGGSAQSAVDSLLGRLSSVLVEEAALLRNVHGDVQFIKREMESMNGFLLDAADDGGRGGPESNQVRAWRRQVHELAFDSRSCVDRYVQTMGARHPAAGAGLLASFGRVPELVRTLPTRHRIATEIKELKSRALEVGERRLRYGVVTPARREVEDGGTAAARLRASAISNQEAEDARRRRALESADVLFDADARAKELVAWLRGKPPAAVPRGRLRRNQLVTAGQLVKKLITGGGGPNDREDLAMELIKLFRGLYDNDNPENVVEAAGFLREAMLEVGKQEVKVISSWLLDKILGRADMPQDSAATEKDKDDDDDESGAAAAGRHDFVKEVLEELKEPMDRLSHHAENMSWTWSNIKEVVQDVLDLVMALKDAIEKYIFFSDQQQQQQQKAPAKKDGRSRGRRPAAASNEDLLEMVRAAKEPMEVARAEARYVAAQLRWLLRVFLSDLFSSEEQRHCPKVVAIVTPPVEDMSNDDGADEPLEETHATELARKVYDHPSLSNYFSTKVWVDANQKWELKERLLSILHQVQQQPPPPKQEHSDSGAGSSAGPGSSDKKKKKEDLEPTNSNPEATKDWSVEDLKAKIAECLKGQRFLIVLADPEDENSWQEITTMLPDHGDSAVIITPRIKYMAQFDGWYTASWFFLLTHASARYHVHFCSNLVGMRKVAAQLVGSDQLPAGVRAILKKCLWDSFATKMFLHALYANPHRSDGELERLMLGLRYSSSAGNASRMVQFCYDDLPRQYQSCLLSLAVSLQEGRTFKRTSLVRRWAAENFVSARDGLAAVDEADRCFDALVARGLLQPADVGPAGKVKSCTLHRRVISFIAKMAGSDAITDDSTVDLQTNLAHRLSTSSGVLRRLMEDQLDAADSGGTCWGIRRRRRRRRPVEEDLSHQVVTFLTSLPSSSEQLGLVKLLDLEGCKGLNKRCLKKICNKIFQLKYLSLRNTDATELPKEINKLRYLETLDIRETDIRSFPENTIALPKLMHLFAGRTTVHESSSSSSEAAAVVKSFSTVRLPAGVGSLTNMQVLSHVEVVSKSDENELRNVGRKLHLRKLGVLVRGKRPLRVLLLVVGMLHETLSSLSVHLEPAADSKQAHDEAEAADQGDGGGSQSLSLNASEIPKSLESLNINGIEELPTWVRQLHRLSKITLCRTSLIGEDLHKLGELASLRCIRLWHQSYTEKKLTFSAKQFRKLELLVIEDKGISDIHFAENAAPSLKKIVWSFDSNKDITLSGTKELTNLKEVHLNGQCDDDALHQIKQDVNQNPNLPHLLYKSMN